MISKKMHAKISEYVTVLQSFVDRVWYPPLLGILALLDNFVIVIPNDGLLISSSMLRPHRWLNLALCISIGSTLGAWLLALVVEIHGMPWILNIFPEISQSMAWVYTERFFDSYGLFLVFVVAISPLAQQPAVILATLSHIPLTHLILVVFLGRMIKFLGMAYISARAPSLINRIWGVKGELEDVGIKVK